MANLFAPLAVGVLWGVLLMRGAGDFSARMPRTILANAHPALRIPAIAMATVTKVAHTEVLINKVRQYDISLHLIPAEGDEFSS